MVRPLWPHTETHRAGENRAFFSLFFSPVLGSARGRRVSTPPFFRYFYFFSSNKALHRTLPPRTLPQASLTSRGGMRPDRWRGSSPDRRFSSRNVSPLKAPTRLTPANALQKAVFRRFPIENHSDGRGLPKRLFGSATWTRARSDMACRYAGSCHLSFLALDFDFLTESSRPTHSRLQ